MKKLTANDPETRSPEVVAENVDRLKALYPEAVTDGKIDFDTLRQLLGDEVEERDEKYGLNWHGKRRARQLALTPSTGTLRPCPKESVDWDTTKNLILEGDNLEVLKLLQKSYSRVIKVIYIDPPYNTGNNLIYPNDYQDGMRAYLEVTGQIEGGARLTSNPDAGGRFHSNWLSMIYPRLKLARNLLRDDGVLVCAIDDNEVAQLGLILREIFEEGSYEHVCVPIVHNPRGVQGKNFSYVHEYVFFVYRADLKAIGDRRIDDAEIAWSQFRNWGTESTRSDAKNCFYPVQVVNGAIVGFGDVCEDGFHPQQTEMKDGGVAYVYPIDQSDTERKWRYSRMSVEGVQHLLRAKQTSRGYEIEIGKDFGLYKTVWLDRRYDANKYGTRIVSDLVPGSAFTFPKSLWAVYDCLVATAGDDPDAVVLDFFAGSGTTAHAVLECNRVDEGHRRFVLVQLPEPVDDNGRYRTIAEIAKARVRAAGRRMASADWTGDVGFRVFKLDTSNIRAWEPDAADLEGNLLEYADHLNPGRTDLDLLYELLLKLGLDLCVPIETRTIAGKAVYAVGAGVLIVCLGDGLDLDAAETVARGIIAWREELDPAGDTCVVFKDSGFVDDVAKTNMAAILHQRGVTDVRSL